MASRHSTLAFNGNTIGMYVSGRSAMSDRTRNRHAVHTLQPSMATVAMRVQSSDVQRIRRIPYIAHALHRTREGKCVGRPLNRDTRCRWSQGTRMRIAEACTLPHGCMVRTLGRAPCHIDRTSDCHCPADHQDHKQRKHVLLNLHTSPLGNGGPLLAHIA